ncbi:hypothetical protein GEV33_009509 [Tenebrio molitor]|uniref:Reverse transcriptase/retrotransposon-derived protein RNase H-like domain-containing protein n=1 Tax=Tenebrio molitor TaxID=7067 RepID=A0A8J6HEI2_TENMO|nr:hypothetical protein GEV33_009509 [Tenebrio molitor]
MPKGRSHFRRYHDEKHSSRRRRYERNRSPHRRRRDGDELPHDLPQHPDGVDEVPRNDGFQGSGYHPDSEMQVLVDTPRAYRWLASPRQLWNRLYYEYHFAKLALIHKLKLPISQGDQVNFVMGGLEDERIKIAIETSNINTPEVLAAHFRVLDEQRLGRWKPETSNDSPTVSPAISKPKTYTNTQRATGAEKYKASSSSARFPKKTDKAKDSTKSFQPTCFKCGGGGNFRRFCPSNNNNDQRSTAKRPLLAIEPKHVNFIGPSANTKKRYSCCQQHQFHWRPALPYLLWVGIESFLVARTSRHELLKEWKPGNLLKFSQLSTLNVNSISEAVVNVGIDNNKVVKGLIGLLNEYSDCRASNISQISVNPTVQMTTQSDQQESKSEQALQIIGHVVAKSYAHKRSKHGRRQLFMVSNGYFRKFINDYAAVLRPFTSLLQKEAPWVWGQAQNTSFEALKTHLISEPVLTLFNPDLEIRLYTDASCLGVAGILIQVNGKEENMISYFSKHTTANERKFHSFELEALAIVFDCAAVRNAFSKGEVNARIGRWVLELSPAQKHTYVSRARLSKAISQTDKSMKIKPKLPLHRAWGLKSKKSPWKSELEEGPPSPSSAAGLSRRPYPRKVLGVLPPLDPS